MATQNTSVQTDFTLLNDFLEYFSSIGTLLPSYLKVPGTKIPQLDLQGKKTVVGFLAVDLALEINDLTDTDIKELQVSVKAFKPHWSVFKGQDDARMLCFGKFSNMSKDEIFAEAQDL